MAKELVESLTELEKAEGMCRTQCFLSTHCMSSAFNLPELFISLNFL